jgi:hypothetical protein
MAAHLSDPPPSYQVAAGQPDPPSEKVAVEPPDPPECEKHKNMAASPPMLAQIQEEIILR